MTGAHPLIIGITGGTGCGKTTLLSLLEEAGALVLDCDAIYHQLLQQDDRLLRSIDEAFPGTVEEGVLQRKKLGAIVFSEPEKLELLNRITHSAVKAEVLRRLSQHSGPAAIDAIALFEGGLAQLCHITVAVTAPTEERVTRLMRRDGITEGYARSRIAAQHEEAWFRQRCTCILENNGTQMQFQNKCLAFLANIGIIESSKTGEGH